MRRFERSSDAVPGHDEQRERQKRAWMLERVQADFRGRLAIVVVVAEVDRVVDILGWHPVII